MLLDFAVIQKDHDLYLDTKYRTFSICECTSLFEQLIQEDCFPSQSSKYAFTCDMMDIHRKYNNRSGASSDACSSIMSGRLSTSQSNPQRMPTFIILICFLSFQDILLQLLYYRDTAGTPGIR
jgi:hypothetical protein